jgi:hypothetical protein
MCGNVVTVENEDVANYSILGVGTIRYVLLATNHFPHTPHDVQMEFYQGYEPTLTDQVPPIPDVSRTLNDVFNEQVPRSSQKVRVEFEQDEIDDKNPKQGLRNKET